MKLIFILFTALLAACAGAGLAPQSDEVLAEQLYTYIVVENYETALTKMAELEKQQKDEVIFNVVDRLLKNKKSNMVEYAYKLWTNGSQNMVRIYFPRPFTWIFYEHNVDIKNKGNKRPLGMYSNFVRGKKYFKNFLPIWKIIPLWDHDKVYFKLMNIECDKYLYVSEESNTTVGEVNPSDSTHHWYLQPIIDEKDHVYFLIFNRKTDEALYVADLNNKGKVRTHTSPIIVNRPETFSWLIDSNYQSPESSNCRNDTVTSLIISE